MGTDGSAFGRGIREGDRWCMMRGNVGLRKANPTYVAYGRVIDGA